MAAAAVKTEAAEEPDWENVHQQGEELLMPPYQRRFENRPLETRVFLLDTDNENRSLGKDEEIGREIDVKREPGSEDEEELGIDWALAHEINRLDLEERESSEVPEEIKAQGARVTIDKDGSSISSESSSENSLLAALEEDDEEYEEERQTRRKRKDSKDAVEEGKEEEDKSSEVAPEVSSPSSEESDSSILSEGRLALRNLTADSSESDADDWEPSASRAARLAAKPKRSLRTQIRRAAAVTHTTTTTTTTISPLTQDQNYTNTSPTIIVSAASPPFPTVFSTSSSIAEEEETTQQSIEVPETSAGSEEPRSEQMTVPLQWMLHQEPFKNARRRLDSSRIRRAFTVGKFYVTVAQELRNVRVSRTFREHFNDFNSMSVLLLFIHFYRNGEDTIFRLRRTGHSCYKAGERGWKKT